MIHAWTPEAWEQYCTANPARRAKAERDRQLITELFGDPSGLRVLEAGCGYGRLTPLLHEAARLVVMDDQGRMVQAVRRAVREVRWGIIGDLEQLPVQPRTFDAVLCVGVLMHVRHPLRALAEVAGAVKPGGRLLVSWNNRGSPWAWPMMLWGRRPGALRQHFVRTDAVIHQLQALGFSIRRVRGDSVLPLTAAWPGTTRALWPSWLWRWVQRLERWSVGSSLLATFGYEVFALAERQRDGAS